MADETNSASNQTPKAALSVVVIFEDAAARRIAMQFCDQLIEKFWIQHVFEVSWWSFVELEEMRQAKDATNKAAGTNLIIFATRTQTEMPSGVRMWIETWLSQRGEREGTLVGLVGDATKESLTSENHMFLRNVAHRGAMDYLTELPQDISRTIPDSLDSFSERAERVTSVLDEILHHAPPPPRLLP